MKNRDVESEAAGRKSNIETDKQNISFLYLSEEDMIDAGVLHPGRCVDVMEETMGLMEDGDFLMEDLTMMPMDLCCISLRSHL